MYERVQAGAKGGGEGWAGRTRSYIAWLLAVYVSADWKTFAMCVSLLHRQVYAIFEKKYQTKQVITRAAEAR